MGTPPGLDGYACCFCGRELTREQATLEHVRLQSRGGPTEIENLKISCSPCNSERGDMGYEKFRGRKGQAREAVSARNLSTFPSRREPDGG